MSNNNLVFDNRTLNISNWTKNSAGFTVFQNNYVDGVNTLTYSGGGGHERLYTKISVEPNKDYELHIKFHSPTGFSFGGYDEVNKEQFFVTTYNPSRDIPYTKLGSKLALSDELDNSASDAPKDYILSFNSGSYSELYVSIDMGQILDGATVTLVFEIPIVLQDYANVEDVVSNIDNAAHIRVNSKNDDGTDTITGVDWFTYAGTACNDLYANGNSWIGLGKSQEDLKVDRRDCAMWDLWREEGTIGEHSFLRIRWSGYSNYSSTGSGAKLTYDVILLDTGDIQLYMVDVPTDYYSGTFTLGSLNYTPPTADNRWVLFIRTDTGYEVSYEPISFYAVKYLVRNEGLVYTIIDDALSEVTGELNAELFQTSGVDDAPGGALLMTLSAPEVLCWTDAPTPCEITATVQGVPTSAHTVTSDHIQVNHPSIYGISSVVATASDGATFLLSFDGGEWMKYNNGTWSVSDIGMTAAELMAIPSTAWSSVINSSQYMQLKATLEGVETVTQVVFNYNNESPTS